MNSQDEYIIEDDGFTLTFFKNGILHREVGPALFWKTNKNKDKFLNLGDEHLYILKHIELDSEKRQSYMRAEEIVDLNTVYYYLDGKVYEKSQFNLMIKKKEAEELLQELNKNKHEVQVQTKKSKL